MDGLSTQATRNARQKGYIAYGIMLGYMVTKRKHGTQTKLRRILSSLGYALSTSTFDTYEHDISITLGYHMPY